MARCILCERESPLISSPLRVCGDCLRSDFASVKSHVKTLHRSIREQFDLPAKPPQDPDGLPCTLCGNLCRIKEGERGYCGIRQNQNGALKGGGADIGYYSRYYDGLPTNCVADWVCPGGSSCGFPTYSHCQGEEYGYKNLAVFMTSCTFNCLFCQNWHFRGSSLTSGGCNSESLAADVDCGTACICYFGGDPASQMPFALEAARRARAANPGRILRICWETNGSMNPELLKKAADISRESGGCLKFDLKAWSDHVHTALCGVSNRRSQENFKAMIEYTFERPDPPMLVASTLLVPGYIDEPEIKGIAGFIADLNPDIPYALLGFYPQFYMKDLPPTSRDHAERCAHAAREAGVHNVRIGNVHLLGDAY